MTRCRASQTVDEGQLVEQAPVPVQVLEPAGEGFGAFFALVALFGLLFDFDLVLFLVVLAIAIELHRRSWFIPTFICEVRCGLIDKIHSLTYPSSPFQRNLR